jgi:hypothetical protein
LSIFKVPILHTAAGILFLVIFFIVFMINEQTLQAKRRRKFKKFRSQLGRELNETELFIRYLYVSWGSDALHRFLKLCSDYLKYKKYFLDSYREVVARIRKTHFVENELDAIKLIQMLKKKKYIIVTEEKITFKNNIDLL